jgi:putative endonuclease
MQMYYTYILLSQTSHTFYFGSAVDLKSRVNLHNSGLIKSTKRYLPWKLVWYGAFEKENEARMFEIYLKTGSGKAFAYKRLISSALSEDISFGRKPHGVPKHSEGH